MLFSTNEMSRIYFERLERVTPWVFAVVNLRLTLI